MFVTNREHNKLLNTLTEAEINRADRINRLEDKFDSLAKELGYEYVSEAVKDKKYKGVRNMLSKPEAWYEDEAVLRYSWKKIPNLISGSNVSITVPVDKKINDKSK